MADIGTLSVASSRYERGEAVLVLKGTDGVTQIHVPEETIDPLRETVEELEYVYDPENAPGDHLIEGLP